MIIYTVGTQWGAIHPTRTGIYAWITQAPKPASPQARS